MAPCAAGPWTRTSPTRGRGSPTCTTSWSCRTAQSAWCGRPARTAPIAPSSMHTHARYPGTRSSTAPPSCSSRPRAGCRIRPASASTSSRAGPRGTSASRSSGDSRTAASPSAARASRDRASPTSTSRDACCPTPARARPTSRRSGGSGTSPTSMPSSSASRPTSGRRASPGCSVRATRRARRSGRPRSSSTTAVRACAAGLCSAS